MKFIRVSTCLTLCAAIASGTLLFVTSQHVQRAERSLATLQSQESQEKETIRVLRAEWDYLNRPDRIEALATQYLGMKQPSLTAVTDNPKSVFTPVQQVQPSATKPAPQPATFKKPAPVPHPQVQPLQPPAPPQRNFQDLLKSIDEGKNPP